MFKRHWFNRQFERSHSLPSSVLFSPRPGLSADIVITHKEPIHACIYNPSFKQVITCSDGSVSISTLVTLTHYVMTSSNGNIIRVTQFNSNLLLTHKRSCQTYESWPFVRGIHRSPVNSPHKVQWRGALMFSLIYAQINDWVSNREAGDLRRHRAHYDVIVMKVVLYGIKPVHSCTLYYLVFNDSSLFN